MRKSTAIAAPPSPLPLGEGGYAKRQILTTTGAIQPCACGNATPCISAKNKGLFWHISQSCRKCKARAYVMDKDYAQGLLRLSLRIHGDLKA